MAARTTDSGNISHFGYTKRGDEPETWARRVPKKSESGDETSGTTRGNIHITSGTKHKIKGSYEAT